MADNPLGELTPYKWLGTQVAFGLVTGWCVGFAAKKLTYFVAFVIGVIFIAVQILAVKGLISVNWAGIHDLYARNAPQVSGLWSVVVANFPYTGAFAVGFLAGFKKA